MNISLCCIVKNEQQFIAGMLDSVKGLVDELIVVDTGSTDSTIEIAKSQGARIFSYSWDNDFAAARNFSVAKASSDWVLVLDADERLTVGEDLKIRTLLSTEQTAAIFLQRRHYKKAVDSTFFTLLEPQDYYYKQGAVGYYTTDDLRLFSNNLNIQFRGAVHESAEDSAREKLANIIYSDIVVDHLGYLLAADRTAQKSIFYLELAQKKLAEDPLDWRNWFQAGAEFQNIGDYNSADLHYSKACQLNPQSFESWRQAGISKAALGNFSDSVDYLHKAVATKPTCPIALNALGVSLQNLGLKQEALLFFEATQKIAPNDLISKKNLENLKNE